MTPLGGPVVKCLAERAADAGITAALTAGHPADLGIVVTTLPGA